MPGSRYVGFLERTRSGLVARTVELTGSGPVLSLTACSNHCLHPRYRSVVSTET